MPRNLIVPSAVTTQAITPRVRGAVGTRMSVVVMTDHSLTGSSTHRANRARAPGDRGGHPDQPGTGSRPDGDGCLMTAAPRAPQSGHGPPSTSIGRRPRDFQEEAMFESQVVSVVAPTHAQ